jgi:hypothetical protein
MIAALVQASPNGSRNRVQWSSQPTAQRTIFSVFSIVAYGLTGCSHQGRQVTLSCPSFMDAPHAQETETGMASLQDGIGVHSGIKAPADCMLALIKSRLNL